MTPALEPIPLSKSYLCSDCAFVGADSTTCSKCASRVLLSLAQVLDRRELPDSLTQRLEEEEILGA